MAYGILQAATHRLEQEGRIAPAEAPDDGFPYLQFERVDDHVKPRNHRISVVERPPLRSLA